MLFSCKDDDVITFNADPSDVQISFVPFPGGAYMNYVLPEDSDICYIQATYNDCYGKEITVRGSYTSDQITLIGFIKSEENVPVNISLMDHGNNISESVVKYFSTHASASYSLFDDVEVSSYWGGFHVKYNVPENSDGFINIGYVGVNPNTQKLDTLLLETIPLIGGEDDFYYTDITDPEVNSSMVVLWTEDFRGNKVKKKIFEKIPIAFAEAMDCSNVGFDGSSVEDPYWKTGWKYLFDGDRKGHQAFKETLDPLIRYCFVSAKDKVPGFWTIDLKESKNLAYVRIYSHINSDTGVDPMCENSEVSPFMQDVNNPGPEYRKGFELMLPNHIKVYGSNDATASLEQWDELGEFYESQATSESDRWTYPAIDPEKAYKYSEEDLFVAEDDNYMQINFDVTDNTYRYIRLEVIETFNAIRYSKEKSGEGQFYMQEFEVYTKKTND